MNLENFELIEPAFIGAGWQPPKKSYHRQDTDGEGRYYWSENELGINVPYLSVTTALGRALPTSPPLAEWKANQGGHEAYVHVLQAAADYGTFMHACIQRFVEIYFKFPEINPIEPLDIIQETLKDFKYVPYKFLIKEYQWVARAKNDLYSFNKWLQDKDVVPVYIEAIFGTDNFIKIDDDAKLPVAGALDLVCELTFNKRRLFSIVDHKSGQNFWDSHVKQLGMYQDIYNEQNERQVEAVFNWRPTDWRKTPTYVFEHQTPKYNRKALQLMLAGYYLENPFTVPPRKIYEPITRDCPDQNFARAERSGYE